MLRRSSVLSEFQYPKYLQVLNDCISACKQFSLVFLQCLFELSLTLIYKMFCPEHVDIRLSNGFCNAANIATLHKFVLINFKCIEKAS